MLDSSIYSTNFTRFVHLFYQFAKSLTYELVVDLRARTGSNWIGSPKSEIRNQIRFPQNLSFVFVVYFIRAHLRGASLGTRTELGHGLIILLEMAWVRQ